MGYFGLQRAFQRSFWLLNWLDLVKSGTFQMSFRPLASCLYARAAIYLVATILMITSGFLVTLRKIKLLLSMLTPSPYSNRFRNQRP